MRIAGLDRIAPAALPRDRGHGRQAVLTLIQKRTRLAKRAPRGARARRGGDLVVHRASDEAELFGGGDRRLALANPIAADLSDMRPSLLPGLLEGGAAQRRPRLRRRRPVRGRPDASRRDEPEGQTIKAAAVRRGTARAGGRRPALGRRRGRGRRVRRQGRRAGAARRRSACRPAGVQVVPGGPAWFHPGRSGTLQFGPKNVIGAFGEMHPKILQGARPEGSARRVRDHPRRAAAAEGASRRRSSRSSTLVGASSR